MQELDLQCDRVLTSVDLRSGLWLLQPRARSQHKY